ncbi:UNVERIFIED_CONTAM: hypothetical protein O8I53_09625 [Campylobacter lari]
MIDDEPGMPQNCSITILPDNNPIYDGIIKAINGIEIFLKTYLKKICDLLKPFVLAIKM